MNLVRPLDNFPLIRTRNVEDLQQAFTRVYIKPIMKLHNGVKSLDAAFNNCQLSHVGLSYVSYGAAVSLGFPDAEYYLQFFPIRGKGEITVNKTVIPLTVAGGATISSRMSHEPNFDADYEHLILRINSAALTKKLAAMTGATINEPLRMHPVPNFSRPAAQGLRRYFVLLVKELNSATTPLPAWVQTQVEQLLMVMFLFAHEHNYSRLLEQQPSDIAPRQVRHAEEYIEANCDQSISLEDLAAITGVSARSLSRAFKRNRGYSPTQFVQQVRLRQSAKH